jgi:putative ABC transport system permease protein
MIFRKMIKNKWLELSLLLGLILSVALISSMPIYTDAILQRMLVKDLDRLQEQSGEISGSFWSSAYMSDKPLADRLQYLKQVDEFMVNRAIPSLDLPIYTYVRERQTETLRIVPTEPDKVDARVQRNAYVTAMSDFEEHIEIIDGRLPSKEPVDGVYEALVTEAALMNLKMVLGNVFAFTSPPDPSKGNAPDPGKVKAPFLIKPVGVFKPKNTDDYYWYNNATASHKSAFFINFELFEDVISTKGILPIVSSYWYTVVDYRTMNLDKVDNFISTYNWVDTVLGNRFVNYNVKAPALKTIEQYFEREKQLRVMLWSLNIPVIIMLGFYLFMVSNLIVERQKTEIAVLRSRGAGRIQIVLSYVIEGVILGIIALIVGPFVGMMLTRMLGASNGFLEFVQRSALLVRLNEEAVRYALIAVASSLVMTIIPVLLATRATIVGHKQQMARKQKRSFFHVFFLDIILIGISIYGLNNFYARMNDLRNLGIGSLDITIDPLLFLVPALFILGTGMFILRIYPIFVRFVYWLGKRWWSPSLYSTLIQVGRSTTQYQFLMIFLIITIATGLFSASAARTLNQNTQEKILYRNGADLTLRLYWENDAPPTIATMNPAEDSTPAPPKRVQYTEPPFEPLTQLPGVEYAAKVFIKEDAAFDANGQTGKARLVGIETDDFGRTSWFKDGLLPYHFYEYLNLMTHDPAAVLISRTLADQKGVREGDPISVGWDGVPMRTFIVYGIIDYFPGFNPNPQVRSEESQPEAPMLIVGHLKRIQTYLALEPYEVWLKLKEDALVQPLYDELAKQKIPVLDITNTRQDLTDAKNDPFQLSINGVMTLGFLISIVICFFGFLLYWILSLSSRILQLGILRAMGISFRQLIGMLTTEQLLTSGAAIIIGVICGMVASNLFVPLFQLSFDPSQQVPPFEVIHDPVDTTRLYAIVTVMIGLGLFILGYMLSRIKIHQAVKLGED